jgi:hypothetical protein
MASLKDIHLPQDVGVLIADPSRKALSGCISMRPAEIPAAFCGLVKPRTLQFDDQSPSIGPYLKHNPGNKKHLAQDR